MDKRPLVFTLRKVVGGGFAAKIALCIFLLAGSSYLRAQTNQMDRQIYLIEAGQDSLVLTYIFTIHNQSKAEERIRLELNFPEEVEDWIPQEGLDRQDIVLGSEGGVFIEKEIKPGLHFAALALKVSATSGRTVLHFKMKAAVGEFMILAKPGLFSLASGELQYESQREIMGERFEALFKNDLKVGDVLSVNIDGIPQGRFRLWILGGLTGLLLALAAFISFKWRF